MSMQATSPRDRYRAVEIEEMRAWVRFYRRAGDPDMAIEILALLDGDRQARRDHMALYLLCRESLRVHQARTERSRRVGHFVRLACATLFVAPVRALRRAMSRSAGLVVECLPETRAEPAVRKLRQLNAAERQGVPGSDELQAPPGSAVGAPTASGTDDARPD
ncbi:hypothetical protein [Azohydromonas aeria]|uniref:hypothetical protein n=1 Tax=Azohydromonas aeria TaxID=2590212 RepID=UPI0012F88F4B|nr:hypothetical protein [Azohydromonas aeria]